MTGLCAAFGITPKTGYKWLKRFMTGGEEALADRSRAPHSCPQKTSAEVAEAIVDAKMQYPSWGPKKLVGWLEGQNPEVEWPAASTAGGILKANDLVEPRKRRQRIAPYGKPFEGIDEPNSTWCADYKGDFMVGNRVRCYPLTITDAYSRYLLCCRGLERTGERLARPWFERVFREFGLPRVIRTDNGTPFAARSLAGLSKLAVWWIRLGIVPERIECGCPEQNGRHERMHLTLKFEAALPPRASMAAQQRAFDRFQREYNNERPHEALGQRTPASNYRTSPRPYPKCLPPMEYSSTTAVRRVRKDGTFNFRAYRIFVSEVLQAQDVGIDEIECGLWVVRFGPVELGLLDHHGHLFRGSGPDSIPLRG